MEQTINDTLNINPISMYVYRNCLANPVPDDPT
uniref:Uncharacterized protein n=1 Tax=Rhizophora mucronata TaxID=61149 RepID=A0A2P2NWJ7_RHIMU